ncbi:MAG: Mov34/MPN/PAD-1 family protein [Acidobacteriales bacterium]|nr:Mov34/MPN/PAD-1 family protein [Terriglobales bacterium]
MKKSQKSGAGCPAVIMEAEVARRIRQHGRSSMKAEVCGVLIGTEQGRTTSVAACIAGVNAAQGGAHVTFTQETWEHIYKIKDAEYPNERIVGWYHSHPGFGVFLSDHDTFIQENFFASPQQVAWVYDPHTDEEGCFGWHDGKIEKLDDVAFRYRVPVGAVLAADESTDIPDLPSAVSPEEPSWTDYLVRVSNYLLIFLLGALIALMLALQSGYLVPRSAAEQAARELVRRVLIEEELRRMREAGQGAMHPEAEAPSTPTQPSGGKANGTKR